MKSFDEFYDYLMKKLPDYMTEEEKDFYKIEKQPVTKINHTLHGIRFDYKTNDNTRICPVIYADDFYPKYCTMDEKQFDEYMNIHIREIMERTHNTIALGPDNIQERIRKAVDENRILFDLINTEQNEAFLKHVPHRSFHDLSIIYRLLLPNDPKMQDDITYSIIITTENLSYVRKTEAELFETAKENTWKYVTRNVFDAAGGRLYCLSYENGLCSAAILLDNEFLRKIAEENDSDLWLMPSSSNEIMALAMDKTNPPVSKEHAIQLHQNAQAMFLKEDSFGHECNWLSNNIYRYDRITDTVTMHENGIDPAYVAN